MKRYFLQLFNSIKAKVLDLMPLNIVKMIELSKRKRLLKTAESKYQIASENIKKKKLIKIAFFVIHGSVWKYDLLYRLFKEDSRFEPMIVICPYTLYGHENMVKVMNESFNSFERNNYRVIKTYNEESGHWIDLKKEIMPDIVFFTNPYKLTRDEYYITNWLDHLTFYVPYSFMITDRPGMQYNELLHNLVFRFFYESKFQKEQAIKNSINNGKNGIALGYPGLDEILFPKLMRGDKSVWKIADSRVRRIIWAPHHTIEDGDTEFNYSNFMEYADVFVEIAKEYEGKIQIAFKPHPILKAKLYEHPNWGKTKTDDYYLYWRDLSNGQLEEGAYTDLFLTSDAMIHDSGSFLVEYISTNKPSLYMIRSEKVLEGFTSLGDEVISCHYKSFDRKMLISFIKNVVIDEQDELEGERKKLIDNYLLPPNNTSASINIFNNIVELSRNN